MPSLDGLVWRREGRRPHVDLNAAVAHQLHEAGVTEPRLDFVGRCTYCDGERFYSYRREGAPMGQHMSFVGIVADDTQ
jgi:hypothetical protein